MEVLDNNAFTTKQNVITDCELFPGSLHYVDTRAITN